MTIEQQLQNISTQIAQLHHVVTQLAEAKGSADDLQNDTIPSKFSKRRQEMFARKHGKRG